MKDIFTTVVRDGKAHVYDLGSGRRERTMHYKNVVNAATDGRFVVVLLNDGVARCALAKTGRSLGRIGQNDVVSISIVHGIITLGYESGAVRHYSLSRHKSLAAYAERHPIEKFRKMFNRECSQPDTTNTL